MRAREVVVGACVALALALVAAGCSDDARPAGAGARSIDAVAASSILPSRTASPSDVQTARQLAQTFADGLRQRDPGHISAGQTSCLVDQVTAHLNVDVLSSIASNEPAPATLDPAIQQAFVDAFARCLPPDVAKALAAEFGGR